MFLPDNRQMRVIELTKYTFFPPQGTSGGLYLLWTGVLSEVEAHGARQNARQSPRPQSRSHQVEINVPSCNHVEITKSLLLLWPHHFASRRPQAAYGGPLQRRRPASGRDGARLPDWLRSEHVASGAPHDLQ